MKKTIGYLGPQGSYSHEVALFLATTYGGGYRVIALEPSKFAGVLKNGKVGKVVLPIVNAIGGQVQWVLDLLMNDSDGYTITDEVVWNIRSHLIGRSDLGRVRTIFSHSQPLDQCQRFLAQLPNITTQAMASTSAAVKRVADSGDTSLAAIGTAHAARIYQLSIIAPNISDYPDNQTRFIVFGGKKPKPTGNDKTTLLFGTPNKPGALLRVLEIFDALGINMKTILSTTSPRRKLGECLFLVDVEGHQHDTDLEVALRKIKERVEYMKILGSYPQTSSPSNVN